MPFLPPNQQRQRWRHSKYLRHERTERQWVINVMITYRRWRELRPYSHRLLTTLMSLKLKSLKTQTHKRHETQTERSTVWFVNVHFWFFSRFITFHVRHSRGEMYSGNDHPCVCWSVPRCIPTLLHRPRCNSREWQGVPSSVCTIGWICNRCMGFVAMTTYTYVSL